LIVVWGLFWNDSWYSPYHKLVDYVSASDRATRPGSIWSLSLRPDLWTGLFKGVNDSADFFKASGLKGPIFSDYDIGGYLLFHLYPPEKLFVDNRQEAYPDGFFKDIYFPAMNDEAVWQRMDLQYNFNVIYLYRLGFSASVSRFLEQRSRDPQWVLVYADPYAVIFVKRAASSPVPLAKGEISALNPGLQAWLN
jgi:hypothetical protein